MQKTASSTNLTGRALCEHRTPRVQATLPIEKRVFGRMVLKLRKLIFLLCLRDHQVALSGHVHETILVRSPVLRLSKSPS